MPTKEEASTAKVEPLAKSPPPEEEVDEDEAWQLSTVELARTRWAPSKRATPPP